MKKILTLGRILIFLPIFIFATVNISVDNQKIYKGQSVNFTISVSGDNIKMPKIERIENYPVRLMGSSTNLVFENGKLSSTKEFSYAFKPESNVTIPSFEIEVDGKIEKTKPVKIELLKGGSAAKLAFNGALVELKASKKEAFVGEAIPATITLKFKRGGNIAKAQLQKPNFANFWVEYVGEPTQQLVGDTIIQTYHILVFPQKSGELKLGPVTANVAKIERVNTGFNDPFFDEFFQQYVWEPIESNAVNIKVKPLPNNLEIYGDFNISATVDKQKVYANKPVNLTIKIKGFGNIDDIKKFDINLPNAVVYSDEPKVKSYLENGKYGGEFTQKVAIVADSNFTIPSIKFKYFSAKEQKVKTLKTKPIKIEVIGGKKQSQAPAIISSNEPKKPIKTETKVIVKEKTKPLSYLWLIVAFILGALSTYTYFKLKEKKTEKKELDIVKKIKKAKDDKELFKVLLPYSKEYEYIAKILERIEENIYKNAKNKIDKKELIEFFEDLEIE